MPRILPWIIGLSLVGAIATVTYTLVAPAPENAPGARTAASGKGKGGRSQSRGPRGEAVPVFASLATTSTVPIVIEGLGAARALNTVTVQPLVDGRLLTVNFKEGQQVARGDLLATIDPALYAAQLKQAEAKKAQDEAQLADARRELERNSSVGPIATLQKNIDTARAKVAQFEALVKADEAAIDTARTQLGYTSVYAPITGRTGFRLVDEGNVVRASSTTGLVVITEVQPIAVLFNLPQQQLSRITRAAAKVIGDPGSLTVEAIAGDGKTVIDRGKLRVIDNQVDQTTGTIRLKAEFPNANLQLWPGQFTSIRMLVDNLVDAVTVPSVAVQQGPSGSFVYVVTDGDKAKVRSVKIAQQDELRAAVTEGLAAGEMVVTSSFSRIRDDATITPTIATPASGAADAGAPVGGVGPGGKPVTGPDAGAATVPRSEAPDATQGATQGTARDPSEPGSKRGRRREAGAGGQAVPAPAPAQ